MLAFDSGRHDLVEGGLHAVEPKLTYEVEDLGAYVIGRPTFQTQDVVYAFLGQIAVGELAERSALY